MTLRVLVVDDEAPLRYTLRTILEEEEGIEVLEAADGQEALDRIDQERVDLVLTDLRMPCLDGMGLLDALTRRPRAPRAILITAYGSERIAVEAMKRGALDYFAKPYDPEEILRVLRRSLETLRLSEENLTLKAALALRRTMVFSSDAMHRVAGLVERVAPRDVTVLVTGESGTGKELVARAIVKASSRAAAPYVRFNCAALPRELVEAELFGHTRGAFTGAIQAREGLFRAAQGGTLLLDEIGELDLATQGTLLRVLQEREVRPVGEDRSFPVDVRLLASTNRDLPTLVESGAFRQDLYYRLCVVTIHVPPLKDRPEDILPLVEHFAALFGERYGLPEARLSDRVLRLLKEHSFPGNVRELANTVERLVALADNPWIDTDPFALAEGGQGESAAQQSANGTSSLGLRKRVAAFERSLVTAALEESGGNQSEAARRLGISRVSLIDKMRKYKLR